MTAICNRVLCRDIGFSGIRANIEKKYEPRNYIREHTGEGEANKRFPKQRYSQHCDLTRAEISDGARERAWLQAGRTSYASESGTVRCIAWVSSLSLRLLLPSLSVHTYHEQP